MNGASRHVWNWSARLAFLDMLHCIARTIHGNGRGLAGFVHEVYGDCDHVEGQRRNIEGADWVWRCFRFGFSFAAPPLHAAHNPHPIRLNYCFLSFRDEFNIHATLVNKVLLRQVRTVLFDLMKRVQRNVAGHVIART